MNNNLVFQDTLFSSEDFFALLNDSDVTNSLDTQNPILNFNFNSKAISENWKNFDKISNKGAIKMVDSATAQVQEAKTYDNFINYLSNYLNERPITELMEETKITGALNVERPSLYIFPAREGDCSFFTFNGYSMLINGGYERMKPCFWRFASMLKQIDSIMITHMDADALGGLSSFFAKKLNEPNVKPNVLSVLGNLVGSGRAANSEQALTDADMILEAVDKLKVKHIQLVKNEILPLKPNHQPEHVNLYYKFGYGSLDMYVLSPFVNTTEYKEFLHHTSTKVHANIHKSQLNVNNTFKNIPIAHMCSAVVLLTWTPSKANESILRMLFTGNAPQHVIANALERVKEFEILKTAVCRVKCDKEAKKVVVKPKLVSTTEKPSIASAKPVVAPGPVPLKPTAVASVIVDDTVTKKPEKVTEKKEIATKRPSSVREEVKKEEIEPKKAIKPVVAAKKEAKPKPEAAAAASAKPAKPEPKPAFAEAKPKPITDMKPKAKSDLAEKKEPSTASKKTTIKPPKLVKQAAKPIGKKPVDVKPQENDAKIQTTRLVAEVGPATSSTISTVDYADETILVKPSFSMNSIKNAWDTESEQKKSLATEDHLLVCESADTHEGVIIGSNEEAVQRSMCSDEGGSSESSEQIIEYDVQQADQANGRDSSIEQIESVENHEAEIVPSGAGFDDQNVIDPTDVENSLNLSPVRRTESKESMASCGVDEDEFGLCKGEDLEIQQAACVVESPNEFIETPTQQSDANTPVDSNQDVMIKSFIDDGEGHNPFAVQDIQQTLVNSIQDNEFDALLNGLKSLEIKKTNDESGNKTNGHVNGNQNGYDTENHVNGVNGFNGVNGNHYSKHDLVLDDHLANEPVENQKENAFKPLTPVNPNDPSQWNLLNLPAPVTANDAADLTENKKSATNPKKPANPQVLPTKSISSDAPQKPTASKTSQLNSSFSSKATNKPNNKPVHPYYFDVSYIPAHGNQYYVDSDFFKRVRARYYVLSTIEPTLAILNSLIEGKQAWEDKDLQVSLTNHARTGFRAPSNFRLCSRSL